VDFRSERQGSFVEIVEPEKRLRSRCGKSSRTDRFCARRHRRPRSTLITSHHVGQQSAPRVVRDDPSIEHAQSGHAHPRSPRYLLRCSFATPRVALSGLRALLSLAIARSRTDSNRASADLGVSVHLHPVRCRAPPNRLERSDSPTARRHRGLRLPVFIDRHQRRPFLVEQP